MNLVKSIKIFDPSKYNERIHILGCGATGSTIAELLVRFGLTKISLYDMDVVESKNIANQMFRYKDIGKKKINALKEIMTEINPEIEDGIKLKYEGYNGGRLEGIVFLCVDNIDVHKKFVADNKYNTNLDAVFETRVSLYEGQHFAADWKNVSHIENMMSNQDFTHEEAMKNTPRGGCNEVLSVAPTIREICSAAVVNMVNFINTGKLHTTVVKNPFSFISEGFTMDN